MAVDLWLPQNVLLVDNVRKTAAIAATISPVYSDLNDEGVSAEDGQLNLGGKDLLVELLDSSSKDGKVKVRIHGWIFSNNLTSQ